MLLAVKTITALSILSADSVPFVWDLDAVIKLLTFAAVLIGLLITLVMYFHARGIQGAYQFAKEARDNKPVQDVIENAATQYIGVNTMQELMKYMLATVAYGANFDKSPEGQQAAKDLMIFLNRISDGKPNVPENDPTFTPSFARPDAFYKSIDDSDKAV